MITINGWILKHGTTQVLFTPSLNRKPQSIPYSEIECVEAVPSKEKGIYSVTMPLSTLRAIDPTWESYVTE